MATAILDLLTLVLWASECHHPDPYGSSSLPSPMFILRKRQFVGALCRGPWPQTEGICIRAHPRGYHKKSLGSVKDGFVTGSQNSGGTFGGLGRGVRETRAGRGPVGWGARPRPLTPASTPTPLRPFVPSPSWTFPHPPPGSPHGRLAASRKDVYKTWFWPSGPDLDSPRADA